MGREVAVNECMEGGLGGEVWRWKEEGVREVEGGRTCFVS